MDEKWLMKVRSLSLQMPSPQIGVLVLPGQAPGPLFPENDVRIAYGANIWRKCCIYTSPVLIVTGDCRDRHGRTSAQYMRDQYLSLIIPKGGWKMEDYIRIGEKLSFHTAASFRYLSEHFRKFHYDLIILVSNSPHLAVAGIYWRRLLPDIPMVKASSGPGAGAIGMSYPRLLVREACQIAAAVSIDWILAGTLLDRMGYTDRMAARWRELEWPPIPASV